MPQRRVQGFKIPAPRPPPVSRAVVKRSRRKGRGVFAAAGGISAHHLACYYPAKVIADPGLNTVVLDRVARYCTGTGTTLSLVVVPVPYSVLDV